MYDDIILILFSFGFKTLERSYLLRINGRVAERPQHMIMRVAVGIHKEDIESVIETYNLMSERFFTHASPTLFNAGTPHPQLSSCFLVCMKDDSIEGIYDTLKTCAMISKTAGGIGLSIHCIRATGCVKLIHGFDQLVTLCLTARTLLEQTAIRTALFLCFALMMLRHAMLIKVATSGQELSRFTLNHGTLTYSIFST
jgi:hypothetical protein